MARVIEYTLEGNGWAQGAVVLSGRRMALAASYILDTFKDMVEALLSACKGQEAVEWVYLHEPTSTHVYLERAGDKRVLTLRRFPDFRLPRPRLDHPGTLISEGEIPLRKIVADVVVAGSRMIDVQGEQEYLRLWRNPLPTRAFADLKDLRHTVLV